jgi:hypothetical protein
MHDFFKQPPFTRARGYCVEAKRWVFGPLLVMEKECLGVGCTRQTVSDNEETTIAVCSQGDYNMPNQWGRCAVAKESVGFFTGFQDKQANEIFTGDIVAVDYMPRLGFGSWIGVVVFDGGDFAVFCKGDRDYLKCAAFGGCRIIGNAYETPGLFSMGENEGGIC